MKLLILLPHSIESPGERFRIYQYLQYFEKAGIEYTISTFLNSNEYINIYNNISASIFVKVASLINGTIRQIKHLFNIKSYDAVLIYREAMLWGNQWIERYIAKKGIPIIFDYDDAIWLTMKSQTGIPEKLKRLLKPQNKFDDIIKLSTNVITGNEYLAQHARLFNRNVSVIPTVVDVDHYKPSQQLNKDTNDVIIGWIGSGSTAIYLNLLDNVWKQLPSKFALHIIGGVYNPSGINTRNIQWSLGTELRDMSIFDIGVMPLPDDDWTKGKCGLKILQYMAMGIPCIASPVGVNAEIIQDGVNGYLARNEKEWVEKLALLMNNSDVRMKFGREGRKIIEERFSVKIWAPSYVDIINKVVRSKKL